ncbi:MAG: hypothetical protein U9Q15_01310 [Patescibacteria group bacterium]|nr:hypothetical protein [Patescibacteria group bacterium]
MENNQNPSTEMQQIVQLMEKQTELMEKLYDTQHDHNKHVKRTHYAGLTWTIIRLGILVAIIFGAYNIFSSLNPAHILE